VKSASWVDPISEKANAHGKNEMTMVAESGPIRSECGPNKHGNSIGDSGQVVQLPM